MKKLLSILQVPHQRIHKTFYLPSAACLQLLQKGEDSEGTVSKNALSVEKRSFVISIFVVFHFHVVMAARESDQNYDADTQLRIKAENQ